jgi:glycosyltransferase involved in cell wall biosynthesis
MKYKLTVTIPSYRQPEQLKRALLALSLQTYKAFTVIIVDDNSGVDFSPIVLLYPSLEITILKNEKNLGAMANMFRTITLTTDSAYILSHHEDDYLRSDYLENAIAILDNNANVSFVTTSANWVKKESEHAEEAPNTATHFLLNSKEFMVASLNREPFIFGSVVYRKKDICTFFKTDLYHTLCDKVFLTEILIANKSLCGYIQEPSIYVRDHSLDEKDTRSDGAKIEHLINFFNFYKMNLPENTKGLRRLLADGLLLSYYNMPQKTSLLDLYKKQKPYHFLSLQTIGLVGVYSVISLILGKTTSRLLSKFKF